MPSDDSLEAFGWVFDVVDHGEFDVTVPDDVSVCFVFLLALESTLLMLKSRLVEVDILTHDDGLDGDKHLQQC